MLKDAKALDPVRWAAKYADYLFTYDITRMNDYKYAVRLINP